MPTAGALEVRLAPSANEVLCPPAGQEGFRINWRAQPAEHSIARCMGLYPGAHSNLGEKRLKRCQRAPGGQGWGPTQAAGPPSCSGLEQPDSSSRRLTRRHGAEVVAIPGLVSPPAAAAVDSPKPSRRIKAPARGQPYSNSCGARSREIAVKICGQLLFLTATNNHARRPIHGHPNTQRRHARRRGLRYINYCPRPPGEENRTIAWPGGLLDRCLD